MRLDQFLVEKKLAETRSKAADLIQRKLVLVNDLIANKNGQEVSDNDNIIILNDQKYVSRGGEKLKDALDSFSISLKNKIVTDIGSSTGGFTDCALQEGASMIYAYDVGYNQLSDKLRNNDKIILFEETNILDVDLQFSDYIVIDVSFTSVIPILKHIASKTNHIIALIKPQFEVGKTFIKGGILKDKKKHVEIISNIIDESKKLSFNLQNLKKSIIKGKSGNQEYMIYLVKEKSEKQIRVKDVVFDA